MSALWAWLIERKCRLFRHEPYWVFGEDAIAVLYCPRCDLVHDVEDVHAEEWRP